MQGDQRISVDQPNACRPVLVAIRNPGLACLILLAAALFVAGCAKGKDASGERGGDEAASEPSRAYAEEGMAGGANARMANEKKVARTADRLVDVDDVTRQDAAESDAKDGRKTSPDGDADEPVSRARMIVYTAWMTLATHTVDETLDQIDALTDELDGYVETSRRRERVIRIPSARYDEAIEALKKLGEVRSLRQESEDITEAYTDLVARIDNLQALERRYRALLDAAQTMEERLLVERELRRIRQRLRELQEQRRVLAHRAAYATISVTVTPIAKQQVARNTRAQPFDWVSRRYGLSEVFE